MKKILMHPPKWLERILSKIPTYRGWYIKQVCYVLHQDVMENFRKDKNKN